MTRFISFRLIFVYLFIYFILLFFVVVVVVVLFVIDICKTFFHCLQLNLDETYYEAFISSLVAFISSLVRVIMHCFN